MKLEAADFPPELLRALADQIAERLRAVLAPPAPQVERYITRREAIALGVERRALLAAERSGELEAFRPGKTVVYRRADVIAFVERHRVVAPAPAPVLELPTDRFERARALAKLRRAR